jgi:uncharacterized protein (TIGR00162 family)
VHEKVELSSPVLIEGLPGVGNVGKLAAEHLIKKLKAKKFASIYSKHFPPQVLILESGVVRLVSNDLFYHRADKSNGLDIIILTGDYQGTSQEGQYDLSQAVIELFIEMGGSRIFTLGGWSVGRIVDEPRVLGAATTPELVKELKGKGVTFSRDEPAGGIVGAAGLLLGLGTLRGIEAACLMGETSGYFSDPKSAQAILEALARILDLDIDYIELEEHSREIDDLTARLTEEQPQPSGRDELGYIG